MFNHPHNLDGALRSTGHLQEIDFYTRKGLKTQNNLYLEFMNGPKQLSFAKAEG
jgi:hypothetical protein